MKKFFDSNGFTLIELLTVIIIVGILFAFLVPAIAKMLGQTKMVSCINNLKELTLGAHLYAEDHNDAIPDAYQLYPYINDKEIFVCPEDKRDFDDPLPAQLGKVSYTAYDKTPYYFRPENTTRPLSETVLYIESDKAGEAGYDRETIQLNIEPLGHLAIRHGGNKAVVSFLDGHVGILFVRLCDDYYYLEGVPDEAIDGDGDDTPPSFGGGGWGCFLAGTKIVLADGSTKSIEQFAGDESVLAFDETNSKLEPAVVSKVFAHPGTFSYLTINNNIRVTPNHPVYSGGIWKEAGALRVGDALTTPSGEPLLITSISQMSGPLTVYNLEVGTFHSYIADGIIAHNKLVFPGHIPGGGGHGLGRRRVSARTNTTA